MVSICNIKLNFAEKLHPQHGNKMSHIKITMRQQCYENLLFDINLPLEKKEEEITDKKIHKEAIKVTYVIEAEIDA